MVAIVVHARVGLCRVSREYAILFGLGDGAIAVKPVEFESVWVVVWDEGVAS